jgi:hypothetical protein
MKRTLLIVGICLCGFLVVAKVWGLIFIQFSIKQAVYAVALLGAVVAMSAALRSSEPPSKD